MVCNTSTWISHRYIGVPHNSEPLFPPSSPPYPGLSQSTYLGCSASCIELALVICFTFGKEISPGIPLEGMKLKLKLQYFGHLMRRLDSLEKTLMLGGIGAGGEGDDRRWDGWMASWTRWTWVWVNSRRWWWTGRPGVLRFMGLQRVGHDWATELNCTELRHLHNSHFFFLVQHLVSSCALVSRLQSLFLADYRSPIGVEMESLPGWVHWWGNLGYLTIFYVRYHHPCPAFSSWTTSESGSTNQHTFQ